MEKQQLDDSKREYIGLLVQAAIDEYEKRMWPLVDERIDEKVEKHGLLCDTAKYVALTKARLFGLAVGLTLGSGSIGAAVATAVFKIFS